MSEQDSQKTLMLAALDMDAGLEDDPRYRVTIALDPTLEYEVTGDLPLLDDLALSPDYITLAWDDARIFAATLLRKISQDAMADFADGDPQKIVTTDPRKLSQAIQKDPTVAALRTFYDATFDDPEGPAQDHHISVKLSENQAG